jgi:hypothetical protein
MQDCVVDHPIECFHDHIYHTPSSFTKEAKSDIRKNRKYTDNNANERLIDTTNDTTLIVIHDPNRLKI